MRNAALVLIAAVVLVLGFVLARDTSEEQDDVPTAAQTQAVTTPDVTAAQTTTTAAAPAEPPVVTIVVEGGRPRGGVQELEFDKGETIRFRVRSDVADHVHVHGFDVMRDVAPGRTTSFSIPARFDGRFEVELEDRGVAIAELRIQP